MNQSRSHRGVSRVEFLGVLLAVGGGVYIGSQYLGVDLNRAAYRALDESSLLEKIPDKWRPANPDCPNGDCPDPNEVRAHAELQLRSELDRLTVEIARLGNLDTDNPAQLDPALETQRDATLGYWQRLTEVVATVERLQTRVEPFATSADQAHVFALRRRAMEYGQRAIDLLDAKEVDSRAVESGIRLAEWYSHGAELLGRAHDLTGRQTPDGRAVSAQRLLAQNEHDHAKRTELVRRKADDAAVYLHGRYLVPFPPLAL
ncbi:MAG: hypothetical protein ACRCT8_06585 [Lacipirellulaceae bacterium]